MELGIGHYYVDKYGFAEGAKKMKELGFTALDFQLADTSSEYYEARDEDFITKLLNIKKALSEAGIRVHQIHGPWRAPKDSTEEDRAERFEKMTKAMVAAKHLGAKYMAIHPLMPCGVSPDTNPEETERINVSFFTALAKVAASLGVIICIENMPFTKFSISTVEQVASLVRKINHPNVKLCFDTGHANLFPTPIGMAVRDVKDILAILHVHDNDGTADRHKIPYDGTVDWGDFVEALYDVGFSGVFNLECAPFGNTDEEKEASHKELIKYAHLLAMD